MAHDLTTNQDNCLSSQLDPMPQTRLETMQLEESEDAIQSPDDRRAFWTATAGVSMMVVYTWFLVLSSDPLSKGPFAFHPPLQVLAVAFFCYGILILQPTSLTQPKAKARGFIRHQLIMFGLGFPSIVFGTFAIWYAHKHGIAHGHHAKSWHGRLGITALVWMGIQIVIGGGSVWFGGRLFGSDPKRMYKYHRASGYLLMTLSLLVVHLGGAWSNFSLENGNMLLRFIAYLVSPALIVAGIGFRIRPDKMPIFRNT